MLPTQKLFLYYKKLKIYSFLHFGSFKCTLLYFVANVWFPLGTLKFEWALFDLYIANVTHQLLILMMLIRECEKLPKQQVDIKFKTQTYTKRIIHIQVERD